MGSDNTYENRVINHTFEPAITPIIFVVSVLCLVGSIIFYLYTRKKLQPVPEASHSKKEITPTVKSDEGMKAQYSDDHLVVTSNMQERLKMFDKNRK